MPSRRINAIAQGRMRASGSGGERIPYVVHTGAFSETIETVSGITSRVLTCTADGIFYIDALYFSADTSAAAYGTWMWYGYRASGNNPVALFIQSLVGNAAQGENYNLILRSAGDADMRRLTTNIISGGVFADDTWTLFKVTRAAGGDYEFFINGASQGTVNDNTYTASSYLVFDIDAGDKVALSAYGGNSLISKYPTVV